MSSICYLTRVKDSRLTIIRSKSVAGRSYDQITRSACRLGDNVVAYFRPDAMPITASWYVLPRDRLVWVNLPSKIYHFQGQRFFGCTQNGKFLCEQDALHEGDRPTRSGQ
jgi:hypothetical protein